MLPKAILTLVVLGALSAASANAKEPARQYRPRTDLQTKDYEKVHLRGSYTLYLAKDQQAPGRFAAAKGGSGLLIGVRAADGVRYGRAELKGRRQYLTRQQLYRRGVRISEYEEKSVVAYLNGLFYTVIGPKKGRGPLLIERRPSRLVNHGKPVHYSPLEL